MRGPTPWKDCLKPGRLLEYAGSSRQPIPPQLLQQLLTGPALSMNAWDRCGARPASVPASYLQNAASTLSSASSGHSLGLPILGQSRNPSIPGVHPGDWHAAADWYREWSGETVGRPQIPDWVRDSDGWVTSHDVEAMAGLGFVRMMRGCDERGQREDVGGRQGKDRRN